ncbi:MFS transporter [Thermosinus carboxydivorans]|uniref:MFS transporter n=1 Tax=Thermosinus carboxydivorans TaxID=261685 RepID=UPI000592B451|nr:MFS transporter [Thermosinus carboxydivorans]
MQHKTKILGVLSIAQLAAMLIWYNFSAVLPILKQEWRMSNDQAGTLLAVFQLGYVIAVLFTGWLTDRIGGKLTFVISAIETGLASLGFVFFADDFTSGMVWRTLAGLGQAGLYVPGMQILSRWYGTSERGRAIGIYTCSLVGAYAGAYYIAAPLAAMYSWRQALLWTSIWAFPAALLVYLCIPAEKGEGLPASPTQQEDASGPKRAAALIMGRAAWLIIAGYMGHMWELYTLWGWIGAFMTHVLTLKGIDAATAISYGGALAATCILMGGFSPGLAGVASDRYGRCLTAVVALVISGLCALFFGWLVTAPVWLVILVGLVYGFFIVADSAIFKAGLTELVPAGSLGLALGLQSVFGFGVTIVSPKLFGMVLDSYGWGWAFAMLGIGPVIGTVCMLALRQLPEAKAMAGGKR